MSLPSIRQRLSTAVVVASLGCGLLTALLVGLELRQAVDELLDGALQESAEILYGIARSQGRDQAGMKGSLEASPHEERLVWQLVSAQGEVLARSHEAPQQALAAARHQAGLIDVPTGWRVYVLPLPDGDRSVQVAQRASDRAGAQWTVVIAVVALSLVVGAATAAWLRARVDRELEPLDAMSDAVRDYDPVQHGSNVPSANRVELLPMQAAIAALGQRLAQLVSNERTFTAHAAHALRTPLAGMDAQLALAQRECAPRQWERLQHARDATSQLGRVVTALLSLFRSGGHLTREQVDVESLIASLPCEGLEVGVEPNRLVDADPDLLAAALLNLLDNAARHGARHVRIVIRADGPTTTLRLEDDGSGFEPSRLAMIRGALAEQRYDQGVGLGLTLADLVARAHGGTLRLLAQAQGAAVEMSFVEAREQPRAA